jgi:exopolyphosphatase / guanosine-5'-triphosphate,3'-diphosphate pyrophosphatase
MGVSRAAAVDIGTNSVRLLIGEMGGGGSDDVSLRTLHRLMTITRLGEGVDRNGALKPEAMARTAATLRSYRELMRREKVEAWQVAATSAARDASNARDFVDLVAGIMETEPRVLSGEEEARLSFRGATYDLGELRPREGSILVVDIGGGSTEIIVGKDGAILEERSLDVGCVRMSERFLVGDPPRAGELEAMEGYIGSVLAPHLEELSRHSPSLVVGTAGTVTTLSGLKLGLREYDGEAVHHSRLTRADVEELYTKLASLPVAQRRDLMHLDPGRADIIVGGMAVLLVFMREAGLDGLLVSEKDILDGLVLAAAEGTV